MYLTSLIISDFLSIKGTITIDIDRKVTILLGSNDHGKTNILRALEHLNDDSPILAEERNWDATSDPSIQFVFLLDDNEFREYLEILQSLRPKPKVVETKPQVADAAADGSSEEQTAGSDETQDDSEKELLLPPEPDLAAKTVTFARRGGDSLLLFEGISTDRLPKGIAEFATSRKPRVELFKPIPGNLQDSVTADQINTDEYEFLQGVLFQAGIDPRESADLFVQDDVTMRAIKIASQALNENLKRLWEQGSNLNFELVHKGDTRTIEFVADDPAVKNRRVRMSKRSDGVTQFFRLSMILYARQRKNPARSYVYLFDEPGIYLHVQGQKDLMQVLEQLADESQVVYATHSLFMLNQNFPERHRLIFKDQDGTKVDQKPYRANWQRATDALGVYWHSSILFSSKILLVEGDSDPLYIYELFRQMIRLQEIDADVNVLGIMSFYDYRNLRFLLQLFKREGTETKVLVLVDGDSEGKATIERVKPLCDRLKVPTYPLTPGKSIEDYVLFQETFPESVIKTLRVAFESEGQDVPGDLEDSVRKSWESHRIEKKTSTGRWFRELCETLLRDEASKVALARNYAFATRELGTSDLDPKELSEAKKLCNEIIKGLDLPSIKAKREVLSATRSQEK